MDREPTAEWKAKHETAPAPDEWADRAFIIEQARRVANILCDAYDILQENRDDEAFFALIARSLQYCPGISNPLVDDFKRLRDATKAEEKRAAKLEATLEMRDAVNRQIVELALEMGEQGGEIIPFPLHQMRQAGGAS